MDKFINTSSLKKVASGIIEDTDKKLANKANNSDIPTNISQLHNDSGFLAEIPSEYITETEIDERLEDYATKDELKTSDVGSVNGIKIQTVTQTEYNEMSSRDQNTLYIIVN